MKLLMQFQKKLSKHAEGIPKETAARIPKIITKEN